MKWIKSIHYKSISGASSAHPPPTLPPTLPQPFRQPSRPPSPNIANLKLALGIEIFV